MLDRFFNTSRLIKYGVLVPALAAGLWVAPPSSPLPSFVSAAQAAQRGPDSLADVVDQVLDAAVSYTHLTLPTILLV